MMKKTRILSLFLSLVLLAGVLTPAPAQALGQGLTQSQTQSQNGPQIPGARADGVTSLNDYDPERDGYFAYLPISYYEYPPEPASSAVLKGDLPVIVWKNKIFVSTGALSDITYLICDEKGDRICISWWQRKMVLTVGQTMASFVLGDVKSPYIQDRFPLHIAPFRDADGIVWVPLTDVCTIMGVDLIAQQKNDCIRYLVNPPQRDVYDVLADFYDDSRREAFIYTYPPEEAALFWEELSSRNVLALDGLWNGDADYTAYMGLRVLSAYDFYLQYKPPVYIFNRIVLNRGPEKRDFDRQYWNMIIAESLLKKLWFGSENEAAKTAEKIVDFTASDLGLLFNDITDGVLPGESKFFWTLEKLKDNFHNCSAFMSDKTASKYESIFLRYKKELDVAGTKLKVLEKGITGVAVLLKTGFSFVNDMSAFEGRDRVLDDVLAGFLHRETYACLTPEVILKLREEYDQYTADPSSHILKSDFWDNLTEEIISGAITAGTGLVGLAVEVVKVVSKLIPDYQKKLDSMLAYQTSLLAITLEQEADYIAVVEAADDHISLRGSALDKEIQRVYMHYKSCATTRELAHEVYSFTDSYLTGLFHELTILEYVYGQSYDERALSYAERIAELEGADTRMIGQVTELYVTVSGKVLTWGDEKPVPDALIEVTTENDQPRLDFTADGDGAYRAVNIPIFWPQAGIANKFEQDFQIRLAFSSEEIEGEDEKHFTFRPKAGKEVDDAHLLQTGSLQTTVVDKESGDPISGAGYRLELANPEIYEGKIEVKVNWGGRSDDAGQVLEEKLPPGLYRATFWADGYESAQAAFEVRSGEVTRLSKVELKKKAVWLIVEEDYQDIANDGLWSVHLYYSYDEKGRLTEIDGERAAQHYRHYTYDESGLMTEQIEGSTGGFWTGRKYSYDELGRVIRIDSYLLMNTDDWRDASWQENGYQTKRYEGENLAETGYYSDKQTLYYSYTYEYNEAGLLVKEVEWSDGQADRVVVYEYDEQGRLIKSTSSSGRIITTTYEYNEAGQLSKETNLYSEYVTLYFYDEHGNMIREERYSRLGKKLASRTTYTYKQFPFED